SDFWVYGAGLAREGFHIRSAELLVEQPYYAEGQSARVLLVTPKPDCTVLLTREADGAILEKRLVTVPGRALELSIPLTRRDSPNVYLSAVLIRDREMVSAATEIRVPPERQLASVSVKPDKPTYKPGD